MRLESWKVVFALLAAGACVLPLTQIAAAQTEDQDHEARSIEGSWTVQVTQVNCRTGDALGSPFYSLLTFSRGGTLVETTANPMFFPAVRGPGHGVWSHGNDHSFKAVSVAFITVNGALAKAQTIRQTINIGDDPDTFKTTSATILIVPVGGGPTITGCATATGTRIK
jgi:hypothetical protein